VALLDRFAPAGLAGIASLARDTEAGSYDGLWVTENRYDPFPSLALAAEHTTRISLGTGVAIAFARTPMTVAYPAWELQTFSEGRFILGLGSQVRAHVTNRFGMPFTEPAARMKEFVEALREIWRCWSTGERLRFEGRFYRHTLMTENFVPAPTGYGSPPIYLAAVGPRMTEVAGAAADGLIAHPFITESYASERLLPTLASGASNAGRAVDAITTVGAFFVVTGHDERELAAAEIGVRNRIGFYGSTPAYRPVLDHHDMGDLQPRLNDMAREGRWSEMGAMIPRELYESMAIAGTPDHVGGELHKRFGDMFDRLSINAPYALSPELADAVANAFRSAAYSGPQT
jgi:probable F420-dependent oxidoreductase